MGVYSDRLKEEVRLEYMRPEQIEAARLRCPAIYVPFGSIEWHGYHNPVGLDTIKAHEQLVGLAARAGGVVYPAVFFGSGGGHTDWPSTFMVSPEPMIRIVTELLQGFERAGYRNVVLLSGHYPNRYQYQDAAAKRHAEAGGKIRVLSLIEHEAPNVGGDHAAKFETSFLLHLHPRTVSLERLAAPPDRESDFGDGKGNWMDPQYVGHPCYGLVGEDPRNGRASAEIGRQSTESLIGFLEAWLREGQPA